MNKVIGSLNAMYNIERAATAIYKVQLGAFKQKEAVEKLTFAVANEQEHADDLKARIVELGGKVTPTGGLFGLAGTMLGFATRLLGKKTMMKADLWVERKAVNDYGSFLKKVNFDEKSAALIKKNIEDEKLHIKNWTETLETIKRK